MRKKPPAQEEGAQPAMAGLGEARPAPGPTLGSVDIGLGFGPT